MRLNHILWNLGGLTAPLLVAAATVPSLIAQIGQEKFGLLALAWGLIGYAGALDLGLGRALTQQLSKLLGEKNHSHVPDTLATVSRITLITGLVGGVGIVVFALYDGGDLIKALATPRHEITYALFFLAIALPAQAMSATYRGVNEAYLNFRGISLVRAAIGVVNFAGPYAVALITTQLHWLIFSLVISRLLALMAFRQLAMNCLHNNKIAVKAGHYSRTIARKLFSFGAWVTVSSVASPILVQADRFLIGALISAGAVSVYVIPYEMVVQSLVMVGAVSSVMFPGLSRLMHESPGEWKAYFKKWVVRIGLLMLVVCGFVATVLPSVLPLWIKNIENDSVLIGQILCIGVFANALGSMYYAAVHAQGRADLTAKLHLVELPLFLLALVVLINSHGVIGAACAWVGRMVFDFFVLRQLCRLRIK